MNILSKGTTAILSLLSLFAGLKANAQIENKNWNQINKSLYNELVRNQIYDESNAFEYVKSLTPTQKINLFNALKNGGAKRPLQNANGSTELVRP